MTCGDPIDSALEALPPPPERPGFFAELRERVAREEGKRWRRLGLVTSGVAAASTVAAALLLALGSPLAGGASAHAGGLVISGRTVDPGAYTGTVAVLDRTFTCRTARVRLPGSVNGKPGFYVEASKGGSPPHAYAGGIRISTEDLPVEGSVALAGFDTDKGIYMLRARCSVSSTVLPLTPKGLPGPASPFGLSHSCPEAGPVLVRMRIREDPLSRRVTDGSLVVATAAGRKPFAFASLVANRSVRGWISPDCVPRQRQY